MHDSILCPPALQSSVLSTPPCRRGLYFFGFFADLKTMTDVAGNPEEERHTDFYYQPWAQEAVCRYFYQKIQQKRAELDSALGLK